MTLPIRLAAVALLLGALCVPASAGEPLPTDGGIPLRVELGAEDPELALLHGLRIDVDAVFDGWARIYVLPEQWTKLERFGFRITRLPNPERERARELLENPPQPKAALGGISTVYHTHATLGADLNAIAAAHPEITRLTSIGFSEQGRELWMMKITDNPDVDEDEPELSYISSMHGDEVVGKELAYNLIVYLTGNYGSDPRVTELVDGAEIWIMPSMNPDGTALGQRYNTNNVDLNRDFPDQFVDPVNTGDGRQSETAAVIEWSRDRRITVSANFHGGALVANYPFDSNPAGTSTYSPAPDNAAFVVMARTYADNNPPMSVSNSHPAWDDGITNGADWFSINGGMQDWNYVWNGGFEVLMELSNVKWPLGSELPQFWDDNRESMLAYFERGFEGLRGIVTDATSGAPVAATVAIASSSFPSYTDPDVGDFHRFAVPGTYDMTFEAVGYETLTVNDVVVLAGPATRVDVQLQPVLADLQHSADAVLDGAGGNGFLDAGEAADLALTLSNLGGPATGVTASLESIGWFATVERAAASYPDLDPGGAGQSLAPHHRVALAGDTPTGHQAGFVLRWQADQAAGVTAPFFVATGARQCTSVDATDLPQAIDDFQTTVSQVQVADDFEIAEVRVTLDLTHTYIGDLAIDLATPSATVQLKLHGSGGGADDLSGTFGDDLTPADSLDVLDGQSPSGTWQLRVTDSGPGDIGSLNEFRLEVCGRPAEAHPPELRFSAASVEGPAAILEWWPYPGLTSYRVYASTDPTSAAAFNDVTSADPDPTDTAFVDAGRNAITYYLVTGVGPNGESPKGHFGQ